MEAKSTVIYLDHQGKSHRQQENHLFSLSKFVQRNKVISYFSCQVDDDLINQLTEFSSEVNRSISDMERLQDYALELINRLLSRLGCVESVGPLISLERAESIQENVYKVENFMRLEEKKRTSAPNKILLNLSKDKEIVFKYSTITLDVMHGKFGIPAVNEATYTRRELVTVNHSDIAEVLDVEELIVGPMSGVIYPSDYMLHNFSSNKNELIIRGYFSPLVN